MMLRSRSVSPSRRARRTSRPPQLGHSGTLGMLVDCGERPLSCNESNALHESNARGVAVHFRRRWWGPLRIGRPDADSENMTPETARDLHGLTTPATSTLPRSVAGRSHRCRACGSALVHRELSVGLVERWVLPLLGRRPYQCLDCGRRFWDRPRIGRGLAGIRKGAAPRPLPAARPLPASRD
jgi:hypothetical protein